MSEPVTIDEEGSFSATFDLRNYDVGAEFDTIYWTGDTRLKTTPGILVEEGEVTSFNQSEIDTDRLETSESNEQSNEDTQTPNDEVNESSQQEEQEEINEESPGFGILLTLLGVGCLILLAKRRSNSDDRKRRMDQ
jgi:hypothetical protein